MVETSDPFFICGTSVSAGESRQLTLKISETFMADAIQIPMTVIRGARPGPVLFVTAAVHGNEINGVDIVRRLIDEIGPPDLSGVIVAIPVVNVQGFHAQSRYLPYHRDLNRCFPGSKTGNNAQRIAAKLFEEIICKSDFGIDLHTAGEGRLNLPQVRADLKNKAALKLARATGAALLIDQPGAAGTLRRAASDAGVPTILFEAGEPGRFDPKISRAGFKNVLNLLVRLKMLKPSLRQGVPFEPPFQVVARNRTWIRATHGGILNLGVKPGDLVYKDDVIGRVLSPFGRLRRKVRSPMTGMVIGVTVEPLVTPGTAIVHIAELKRCLAQVERALQFRGTGRTQRLVRENREDLGP